RNLRGRYSRPSPLHRRGLQHSQTPLRARLSEPGAIRGSPRPATCQNRCLKLSTLKGALHIEVNYRYASADLDQMRAYAAELVGLPAEVIVAGGSLAVAALRRETNILPIVFVRVADPVGQGFVASLARPGNNVTGFTSFEYEIIGKCH